MSNDYSYKSLLDGMPSYLMKVKQDARLLIEKNVWDSISLERLESWLGNFESEEEKLLSGILLEQLIFRSAGQTKALLYNAIESVLPNLKNRDPWAVLDEASFIQILGRRNHENHSIRIIPVIRDSDPPTKSGPSVARLYKRHLHISDDFMIWPWQLEENYEIGIRTFIFIDDVIGSGDQFLEFLDNCQVNNFSEAEFIYIPLLANQDGIDRIVDRYPNLKVGAVEVIDQRYNFFNRPSLTEIRDLKELYLEVESRKLNKRFLGNMSLGYGQLSLTFSYDHATPNATLPLYWYEDENFYPLVKR